MSRDVVLAISASERLPAVALKFGDAIVRVTEPPKSAGGLTAAIATLFSEQQITPADLDAIVLDLGPGSYTGLRVAVTFARMMHRFRGVAVHTCTSLQLYALAAVRAGRVESTRKIRPVLDARRERFHHGLLTGETTILEPPRAEPEGDLLAAITANETVLAADALHEMLEERVTALGGELLPMPILDAAWMFDPVLQTEAKSPEQLDPLYLMGTYADT